MAIQLTSPQDVASYLNTTQEALNEVGTYDPLEDGSVDKFMEDKLGMTTPMPEAPNYLDTYKKMREELGLGQLEQSMAWYKDAIRREELLLNQQKNYMRDQPVRLGVIEGRVDKATRDRQEQIQWYGNELSRVSDMVQSAYNQINLIMQFTQMDYETAKGQYETEFNTRMNVYKAITDQYNADRAFASTQWSMIASYISKGQTSWDQLTPDQKAQIAKYEAVMGLPIGFMSTLKMEAGANVITTSQRVGSDGYQYVDMIIQGADGKPRVESIRTGKVKTSSGNTNKTTKKDMSSVKAEVYSGMDSSIGKDGYVSPTTYNANKAYWIKQGGSAEEFDKEFSGFVNPTHYWNVRDGVWKSVNYNTTIPPER